MMVLERNDSERSPLKPKLQVIGRGTVTMRSVKRPLVPVSNGQSASPLPGPSPKPRAVVPTKTLSTQVSDFTPMVEPEASVPPTLANDSLSQTESVVEKRKSGWFVRLFGGSS